MTKTSICLSLIVCLCLCLSICLPACVSVCLHVSLSVCMCLCLPVCLRVSLSVCLSVCLHVSLSVCVAGQAEVLREVAAVRHGSYDVERCSASEAHVYAKEVGKCTSLNASSPCNLTNTKQTQQFFCTLVTSITWSKVHTILEISCVQHS